MLIFKAYSVLQSLSTAAGQRQYPNVRAQAQRLGTTEQEVAALRKIGNDGVRPGIDFFLRKFNVELYDVVRAFKAARYACPMKVQELRPTPEEVNALRAFPFLDSNEIITNLQKERPHYLTEAKDVELQEGEQLRWWFDHSNHLPHWSTAVKLLALVQPSSAAAERIFSLLRAAFNDQQERALEDNLEASVMLAYNHRG